MPVEVDVMCLSLLIYDYLCTLKEEAEYIWPSRWSIGQGLFYLNRYLVFVDQILFFWFNTMASPTEKGCSALFRSGIWILIVGENISTVILFLQTWAIWGGKRRIVYPLGLLQLVKVIASLVITHLVWDFASYPLVPSPKGPVCVIKYQSRTLVKYRYVLFVISEAFTVGLTLIRARYHLRKSCSSWVSQLYRNGVLFSVVVLALSIANLIIPRMPWKDLRMIGILSRPQRILDSILCNRVMFVIFKHRQITNRLPLGYNQSQTSGMCTSLSEHVLTAVYPSVHMGHEADSNPPTTEMYECDSRNLGHDRPSQDGWIS